MKTIFILFAFFCLKSSFAQIPDYFNNNPEWICNEQIFGILPSGCWTNKTYKYYLDGDTIIGSHTYKKVKKRGWVNDTGVCFPQVPYTFTYYDDFSFGFRQDGRRIYINKYGQDSLYVDYNLNVGDTLSPCFLISTQGILGDSNFVVQSIDSVLFSTGYRNRYHFIFYPGGTSPTPYFLIEGVGVFSDNSMAGLFDMDIIINDPFEWYKHIDCYLQNGVNEYGTGSCDLSVFDSTMAIEELSAIKKELLRITDLTGRETEFCENKVLLYYYSDGTIERRFSTE